MSFRWSGSLPGVSQFNSLMYLLSVIVATEQHKLQYELMPGLYETHGRLHFCNLGKSVRLTMGFPTM